MKEEQKNTVCHPKGFSGYLSRNLRQATQWLVSRLGYVLLGQNKAFLLELA
jgi:hypothetical protein